MTKSISKAIGLIISAAIIFSNIIFPPYVLAQDGATSCVPSGYTVAFINGVWSPFNKSAQMTINLQNALGPSYNNEPLEVELLYNQSAGEGSLTDLIETFQQRAGELDSTGTLGRHWELFWLTMSGISNAVRNIDTAIFDIQGAINSKLISDMQLWNSASAMTMTDYKKHENSIDPLIDTNQKILFLAHSQGNLFLDHDYDYAVSKSSKDNIQAVQVAPASVNTSRGAYVLSSADRIINGLRAVSPANTVASPSVLGVPNNPSDFTGHFFEQTYMNGSLIAADGKSLRSYVETAIGNALAALKSPVCRASLTAIPGNGKVTLNWNSIGKNDVYNLYYSTLPSVTPSSVGSTKVSNVKSGVIVDGLTNGTPYYFLLTDASLLPEAVASNIAGATPAGDVSTYTYNGSNFNQFNGFDPLNGAISAVVSFNRDMRGYSGQAESFISSLTISLSGDKPRSITYPSEDICYRVVSIQMEDGKIVNWNIQLLVGAAECHTFVYYTDGTTLLTTIGNSYGHDNADDATLLVGTREFYGAAVGINTQWQSNY